jgi:hypothetical protein
MKNVSRSFTLIHNYKTNILILSMVLHYLMYRFGDIVSILCLGSSTCLKIELCGTLLLRHFTLKSRPVSNSFIFEVLVSQGVLNKSKNQEI